MGSFEEFVHFSGLCSKIFYALEWHSYVRDGRIKANIQVLCPWKLVAMLCVSHSQINQTEDLELRRNIRRRQKNIREKRHGTYVQCLLFISLRVVRRYASLIQLFNTCLL